MSLPETIVFPPAVRVPPTVMVWLALLRPRLPATLATDWLRAQPAIGRVRRALRRATDLYRDPSVWHALQQAGMRSDHSWDRSAREYVKIYTSVAGRRSESWQPKM